MSIGLGGLLQVDRNLVDAFAVELVKQYNSDGDADNLKTEIFRNFGINMSFDEKDLKVSADELAQGAAQNAADAADRAARDKAAGLLGTLRVEYDKKGRKGKPCTIISGFDGTEEELVRLKKLLQARLATGGSHCFNSEPPYDGQILLQGDCRVKAADILRGEGYRTK